MGLQQGYLFRSIIFWQLIMPDTGGSVSLRVSVGFGVRVLVFSEFKEV